MRDDECRTLYAFDDGRHRIGFARACDAQQNLARHAGLHALRQRINRLRLVALRLEWGFENEASFLHVDLLNNRMREMIPHYNID